MTAEVETAGDDWLDALRNECGRTSQARAAARIGYSASTVNQILKRNYKGDWSRVEEAVRGALMGETVVCPVLGETPRDRCLAEQTRPFAATSPQRVAVYQACRRGGCPHSRLEPADDAPRPPINGRPSAERRSR